VCIPQRTMDNPRGKGGGWDVAPIKQEGRAFKGLGSRGQFPLCSPIYKGGGREA
jgi:hypothetical protein